ncbi:MAG: helix-turn-helix domain-containing protein [Prevotella sp.]|nr:helix-turn-helix domain-containing protein [Prevotella sp.]
MKDRIRQIMESQHMTQKTFAGFIGMSEGSLSSIFNGRTRPTLNIVEAIKNKVPAINTDWLMFGKGKMYDDDKGSPDDNASTPEGGSQQNPMLIFDDVAPTPYPTTSGDTRGQQLSGRTQRNVTKPELTVVEKPRRQITEIRVFFDDQTWESFVPKK